MTIRNLSKSWFYFCFPVILKRFYSEKEIYHFVYVLQVEVIAIWLYTVPSEKGVGEENWFWHVLSLSLWCADSQIHRYLVCVCVYIYIYVYIYILLVIDVICMVALIDWPVQATFYETKFLRLKPLTWQVKKMCV